MDPAPPSRSSSSVPEAPQGFAASITTYLEARGVLLTIEAQEAVQQILRAVVYVVMGAITALTGWALLTAALVGLLMNRAGWNWMKAVTVAGTGNIVIAFIFFMVMASRVAAMHWFPDTLNEFKKDRQWLARQTGKH